MAGVTCIFCKAENDPGEQLCRACFRRLPAEPAERAGAAERTGGAEPTATPQSAATAQPGGAAAAPAEAAAAPASCPHCGAEVPDPGNRVCVECHRPLTRTGPMVLSFPDGEVTVDAEHSVKLGRDPAASPVAGFFTERGNVSRLHATVGVDADGPWVRDERSLNGTYVNDVPVPPGTRIGLTDGDKLRLAADVVATVQLGDQPT